MQWTQNWWQSCEGHCRVQNALMQLHQFLQCIICRFASLLHVLLHLLLFPFFSYLFFACFLFFFLSFILISCFHAIFVFPMIKNFEKCAYFLCRISCFFSSLILISADRRLILRVSLVPLPVRISLRAALWIQSQVQVC